MSTGLAQSPDPATVLSRAGDAQNRVNSLQIDAITIVQQLSPDFEQTTKSKLAVAYEKRGKFRVEVKGLARTTVVSDGAKTWRYNAFMKQYTMTDSNESLNEALKLVPATLFPRDGAAIQSAKLTGEEDVTVGGEVHHCYVIEATFHEPVVNGPNPEAGGTTLWIDKSSYIVLKTVSQAHFDRFSPVSGPADMKSTLIVESLKVDQPLAAELFKFDPPPGAKQVDSFQFGGGQQSSKLVGKSAPPFKLEDLSGQRFELASLRGKPVLLDFWTTWCGPCKEEIPVLEKLHRDNPDLMVLGVDVGEDAATVRKFMGENKMTYPILLGGKDRMVESYEARAFPSVVVIDKDGVVRNYLTGYGKETDAQLRPAILAAGKPAILAAGKPAPQQAANWR
jgi:outer membrane lipoprotein-sorting protein/peroxiredoxin